jgi:hypothetical protein
MKLLFSSPSEPEVGLLKCVLEDAGIPCEVRNEGTYSALPGAPFQPELWILHDADYEESRELLDGWQHSVQPEPSPSDAIWRGVGGFVLLAGALVVFLRRAHSGGMARFIGLLILFGIPGAILLWSAVAQLRTNKAGQSKKAQRTD